MPKKKVTALLRFSEKEVYLRKFVEEGILFFNTVEYFRVPDSNSRYDEDEFLSHYYQAEEIKSLTIGGQAFELAGPLKMRSGSCAYTHLCCFMSIFQEGCEVGREVYSRRVWNDFGEYVVLIHNVKELIRRVQNECTRRSLTLGYGLVDYIDEQRYSGEFGPYRKFSRFSWQKEFRFTVTESEGHAKKRPLTIKVGSISDIVAGPIHRTACKNLVGEDTINI